MTNFIKSHSFIVRKANGIDDFRIQLRAGYWSSLTSERKLRAALEKAILQKSKTSPGYAEALAKKYAENNLLYILRDFGMIAGSERLTKNQK